MPPAPGITLRKHNQEGSVTNSGDKSAEVIRHELESVAMDICVNHEEDESFEADVDDTDEEKTENDNQTAGSSPVSATSSTKENVVPGSGRKKAKAVRRLIMTYSPKRKRTKQHASGGSTRHSSRSTSVASSCVGEAKTANEDVKVKIEITDEKSDSESSDDDGDETRGEGVYVVERIDGKQVVEGVTYYFIKWKGWDESANTWEPIEHLDGCSELLDAFSKREAEKRSHKRRAGSKNGRRDSDEEDENEISETQRNMRSYGILTEWPADKEPISVEGVITVDGALTYVVKRRARLGSRQLDRTNTILVHADGFRENYPQLVIAFYQGRVLWCEPDNQKTESEKAAAAAQVSLLAQHRGIKQEVDMTNDINSDMQMDCEVSDENPELPATEGSSKTMPFGLEHDTQVIPTDEEDALDTNPPSDDSDDNDIAQPNLLERIIKTEVDKFGLPEDLEDDVSTDSEAEFVESPSKNCMNSINTSIGNTKPVTLF
ncbi:Chromobox protein 5 [Orchesella cincta]|uniref:Chromobox protein 5 n=1 Tax=Orchesella cincta TaxID=48709 RepID=A0A1D2N4Y6_ORCCI|nr:Chromobox protein 5 [Orchesella cincta]